jgi:hypothetical protein
MARVAIETQAAPATQGPMENQLQEAVAILVALGTVAAVASPGVLAGAAGACLWRWLDRPPLWARLTFALLLMAPFAALQAFVVWGWPVRDVLAAGFPAHATGVDWDLALRSFSTEALAGPLWFEAMLLAATLSRRRVSAQVRRDHRLDQRRWRAISGRRQPMLPDPHTSRANGPPTHPAGHIRLGVDAETNGPLDLELPGDLATHVFLPGASGTGKTTTVTRLADGALANGYGVVIIDAKGSGLGRVARRLAERHAVPFHLVDPDDPASLGYNPCSGDAASVANKLVGAFNYSPAAEIYKNIGMEAIPVVVRGLQAAKQRVTLDALYDAFGTRGMEKIAQQITDDEPLRERLLALGNSNGDRVSGGGHKGMQHRLGALIEGKFGGLFRADTMLDWDVAVAQPSVTYLALSTLASGEDVELMGRVIAQDLKQVCARRMRAEGEGQVIFPVLAIFDEFAALNEAEQLVDLLLQARQALMPTVISTQYLPESVPLRRACLGAGLLLVHRVEAEDAEAVAAQFGTRRGSEVTHQVDYDTGYSEKGSIRRVEKFNVHPNELRNFDTGQAAYKSVPKKRYTILRVYPDTA